MKKQLVLKPFVLKFFSLLAVMVSFSSSAMANAEIKDIMKQLLSEVSTLRGQLNAQPPMMDDRAGVRQMQDLVSQLLPLIPDKVLTIANPKDMRLAHIQYQRYTIQSYDELLSIEAAMLNQNASDALTHLSLLADIQKKAHKEFK